MWTYKQSTGEMFAQGGERVGIGYAGRGEGKNNPALQQVDKVGPLPRGRYHIGSAYHHPKLGPLTMNLEPQAGTEMYGRFAFRIHGDSITDPGTASEGCIVQNRTLRAVINLSGDRDLHVIA